MGSKSVEHRMVTIEKYKKEDYGLICEMWQSQGLTAPPIGVLGDNGLIGKFDNNSLCSIFIFNPTSEMGMLEFMACNKNIEKAIRNYAIDIMLQNAIDFCKEMGYKYIYTATSSNKFISRLQNNGFIKKGRKQQHMFWGL